MIAIYFWLMTEAKYLRTLLSNLQYSERAFSPILIRFCEIHLNIFLLPVFPQKDFFIFQGNIEEQNKVSTWRRLALLEL